VHRLAKRELQVACPSKRWTLAIGSHHNILIFFSRYPLDGALDLGDLAKCDLKNLEDFFTVKEIEKVLISTNKKWTFMFDQRYRLNLTYTHHPFVGSLELGEISTEHCQLLADMFLKAQKLY